jgi:formate-dependent nitrite reductase membrane component NrfD
VAAIYERRWETRRERARSVSDETRDSYYGLPVVHKPHWKWAIVLYLFLGGISGASYAIASVAQLVGGSDGKQIARAGRYLSFAALLPSPLLLIHDLGRRERFHYMLRVLKIRSPMSVGVWTLTLFSAFSTASALIQAAQDGLLGRDRAITKRLRAFPAGPIGAVGSVPAFFLAGYTGVLLAATAVPLWTKDHLLLPPLFVASATSNAAAAIALILASSRGSSQRTLNRLQRLGRIAALAELGLLLAMRRNSGPVIARPIEGGRLGQIHHYGVVGIGILVPLSLQAIATVRGAHARTATMLSSALTLAGGLLFRYVIVFAGHESADDPAATFALTRRATPEPLVGQEHLQEHPELA